MAYTKMTRYKDKYLIEYEGVVMYDINDRVDSSYKETDIQYRVNEGDDLKHISFILYKDARYWWIIAEFNKIINPFMNLQAGIVLRCPSLSRIRQEIV